MCSYTCTGTHLSRTNITNSASMAGNSNNVIFINHAKICGVKNASTVIKNVSYMEIVMQKKINTKTLPNARTVVTIVGRVELW